MEYRSVSLLTKGVGTMVEAGEHGKLTIVLHSGHQYDIAYKHRSELLQYFANPEIPQFIFQTTDGVWVYLQKGAIAAIESDSGEDRPKRIHGFAVIGEVPE